MVVRPYNELVQGRKRVRTFESSVDREELVWHRDRHTRKVTVLEGSGWRFQYDNEVPQSFDAGTTLTIPKEAYHRLIAGDNKLVIEIEEYED